MDNIITPKPPQDLGRIRGTLYLQMRIEQLLQEAALVSVTYEFADTERFSHLALRIHRKVFAEFTARRELAESREGDHVGR